MALSPLLTALKIIPWTDVIGAAPGILKGARKMFQRTEQGARDAAETVAIDPTADPQQRLHALEVRVLDLVRQQTAAAQLVEALAEQNAAIVQAMAVLRSRQRWLIGLTGVAVVTAVWALVLSYGGFGPR